MGVVQRGRGLRSSCVGQGWTGEAVFAKTPMFAQTVCRAETLVTRVAFEHLTAIAVHSFVAAQVAELSVSFQTHFTTKWFDRAVNVRMLLQTGSSGKGFTTFSACMCSTATAVLLSNVTLQVRSISKRLAAMIAVKFPISGRTVRRRRTSSRLIIQTGKRARKIKRQIVTTVA